MEKQFVPLPIQANSLVKLNKDLIEDMTINTEPPQPKKQWQSSRNKYLKSKCKSLLRPTPIKNYKIAKEECESEDDVISEMRWLTVRPIDRAEPHQTSLTTRNHSPTHNWATNQFNDVEIWGVSMKTKRKILKWLEDINLIRRKAVAVHEFPQYWRNGVIFFDLVNKLSGRTPVLKGVQRNPKNITFISANFTKVLTYLRQFPKMNARYLWSDSLMMDGNSDVIWGFLDDVWYWFNNKISPFDKSKTADNSLDNTLVSKSNHNRKSSIGSIDNQFCMPIHNKNDELVRKRAYEEVSCKISPERSQGNKESPDNTFCSPIREFENKENRIPDTNSGCFNIKGYNSSARRSYSSIKQKQKSITEWKEGRGSKPPSMLHRQYSASKKVENTRFEPINSFFLIRT